MKSLRPIFLGNLVLIAIATVMYSNSTKVNRDVISLANYSDCFDNFTQIVFCRLDNGAIFTFDQIPPNATLIVGDSHGLVFADILRNFLPHKTNLTDEDRLYFFSGISSCLPVPQYDHEVAERQDSCTKLGELAKDWQGDLIYAAKWLKYPSAYFNFLRDEAVIISQAPQFILPPSAIPAESRALTKIDFSEYETQQASYSQFFNLLYNPYEEFLCDHKECQMTIDDITMYSDEHHLSASGTFAISQKLRDIDNELCQLLERRAKYVSC